ncbi:hypothetical protein Hanom_Chr06g00559591 [Helianthus anomalus]
MTTMTASRILVFYLVSLTDIKDPMTRSGEQVMVAPTKLRVTTVVDTKPETRTQTNILNQSISAQNLRQHARLQRAYSDHNLCYSANNVQASMNQPKLKNNCSMGVFNLKPSSPIVPNALNTDVGEIMAKEVKKRGNWIEMLMEIRSRWV